MSDVELPHAMSQIQSRVHIVRVTSDAAEFITKAGYWIDIARMPTGWRARVYRHGSVAEKMASTVPDILSAARQMAR